jgi:hypothetical protein
MDVAAKRLTGRDALFSDNTSLAVSSAEIDRNFASSDRSAASSMNMESVAGEVPAVSRAMRTVPREAEHTRRAGRIRTQ